MRSVIATLFAASAVSRIAIRSSAEACHLRNSAISITAASRASRLDPREEPQKEIVMSNLELFSMPLCPFAHRVRLVLAEKKIDYRLTEIDLGDKPQAFLKVSPYGRVPALRHDGTHVCESAIINEYLD